MANLGRKYTCYSCHTKFYDLGKTVPLCPKCGADQRNAEDEPVTPVRSRKVVEVPIEEESDFAEEPDTERETIEDEEIVETDDPVVEEEEEEEY